MNERKLQSVSGDLPEAPYPADTSTKGWRFELDLPRIWKSDTWVLCPPDVRPWLYQIWAVAFEQTPAGSLPNDRALIAAHIGMDRRLFDANAEYLLRGFKRHADGRLYHPVVSERVQTLIGYRDTERERKAAYRDRMRKQEDGKKCPTGHPRDSGGIPVGETLQEQEQEQEQELELINTHTDVCVSAKVIADARVPTCPHQKIIDLYHWHCPGMPQVRTWNGQRPKWLSARWREHPDLEWWDGFLQYCGESKFLNGGNGNGWRAGLDWLIRPENFQKVNEGRYHQ